MQEISVVRRRSRLWPIVLAVVVLAMVAFAIWWFSGARGADEFGVQNGIAEPALSLPWASALPDGISPIGM
jgi:hypothetical protein